MHRFDRPRRLTAYAIAGLAGFVDATGYLAAQQYFVSFMSGNTTRLGVDAIIATSRAFIPGLLILGFVLAVAGGALLAEWAGGHRKKAVIGLSAALLVAAALMRQLGSDEAFMGFCVLAMGVLNNSFHRDGEVAIGLTYMTGALVRFGQGLAARLRGKAPAGWTMNGILWASLASGGALGALAASTDARFSAWMAAGFAALLLLGAARLERKNASQSS